MHLRPYIPDWIDLRPFAGELTLAGALIAVLLTPFFVRKPNTAVATVSLLALAIALAATLMIGTTDPAAGRLAPMLAADGVAMAWKIILLLFTAGVVLLWFAAGRHGLAQGDATEFFLLLLSATLGMSLMGSASNLLMIFLAVELASLPSYVLAGFRKSDRLGAEASLKYVLFGAVAAGVMVWGLSLLYGLCGTLNLHSTVSPTGQAVPGLAQQVLAQPNATPLMLVALLAVGVGVAFKIAAAPFHLWCPDVFQGASLDVTAFLSVASKGAGLILLLRLMAALAEPLNASPGVVSGALAAVVGVGGALTATVGNTAAFVQTNLKRLLAYSSIAHAGYMMCAIAVVTRSTPTHANDAASAGAVVGQAPSVLLFYLAVYLFMNLGAFAVVAVVARAGKGETLDAFNGLGRRAPLPAACMAVCCLSLIGVPPLAGFTAKFNVMQLLAGHGGWGWALLAAIAVNTLLSIYYYARVLRAMYLQDAGAAPLRPDRLATGIAVVSAAMLLALFVGSNALARAASATLRPVTPASIVGAGSP